MRNFGLDLRSAIRSLRKSPGISLLAIATLAVGIGANTAIFSVVDAVLLRPLAYPRSGSIVRIWAGAPERGLDQTPISYQRFQTLLARNQVFESVGAYAADSVNLTGAGEPIRLNAVRMTSGVLETLQVKPAIGRNFRPAEDPEGAPNVVLLSDHIWRERFGADREIVGKSITIDGISSTVVGVLPPDFRFPTDQIDVWVPRVSLPNFLNRGNVERGSTYLNVVARMKPGVDLARAGAELDVIARNDARAGYLDEGLKYRTVPLKEDITRSVRPLLVLLLGAVGFVLLIACANVTNLLLAKAVEREREVAVRKALGATRIRLIRQFLTESILLGLLAGAAGALLARVMLHGLVSLAAESFPRASEIRLDLRVLAVTALVAVATGVLFGIVPALRGSRTDARRTLSEGGRGSLGGVRKSRLRELLVTAEVALATVLLTGAGLLLRTLFNLSAVDPGFRPDHLLVASVSLPPSRYASADRIRTFFSSLESELSSLPGVRGVGAAEALPLSGDEAQTLVAVVGRTPLPLSERPIVSFDTVSTGYFDAMSIPLEAGRKFASTDDASAPIRVIVSRSFVRRFFPRENPIGRQVMIGKSPAPREIIGVVGDVRGNGLESAPREEFYLSSTQRAVTTMEIVVRTSGSPLAMGAAVRRRVLAVDPDQPLAHIRTMDDVIAGSMASRRFVGLLLGLFAGVALALAAMGLAGVIAYGVRQVSAEIGLRIALGASTRDVLAITVGGALRLVAAGLVIGVASALVLSRLIANLLFGVHAADPPTIVAIAAILFAVAGLASYLPALRATRIDPMTALRSE